MGGVSYEEMVRAALETRLKILYGINTVLVSWIPHDPPTHSFHRTYKVVYRKEKILEDK